MRLSTLILALSLLAVRAVPLTAQQCDDFEECTANDMCSNGECTGTPAAGSCDDGNPCTINDSCVSGNCTGAMAPNGTTCGNGCGQCMFGFCAPNIQNNGNPCNDNFVCTTNDRCQFGICFGDFRVCPDSDNNVCTIDFCNPVSGLCEHFDSPPCLPCQVCRATGGNEFECDPGPNGGSCDDFNECTGDGICSEGDCSSGAPITPGQNTRTPTASATAGGVNTPTRTSTVAASPTRTSTVPANTPTRTPTVIANTATITPTVVVNTATRTPSTAIQTATQTLAANTPSRTPSLSMFTPTQTLAVTVAISTPTRTQTVGGNTPTVQPTATTPQPTATGVAACVGDCGLDGEVSVDEIVTAVNIALGNRSVDDCRAADGNNDDQVTVEEIIQSVNNALNGCPA